MFDVDADIS